MILGSLGALLLLALIGTGLLYDGLGRDRRRIAAARAALLEVVERRDRTLDPVDRAGVEARLLYARAHLDDLLVGHGARLRRGASGALARGLKLQEPAS